MAFVMRKPFLCPVPEVVQILCTKGVGSLEVIPCAGLTIASFIILADIES